LQAGPEFGRSWGFRRVGGAFAGSFPLRAALISRLATIALARIRPRREAESKPLKLDTRGLKDAKPE
jgi:hypothetical protein